jgi:hypothetical protein
VSLTVVTGWSPAGFAEYGHRFAAGFARYWPPDVDLVVYGEEPVALERGEFRRLDSIPGCSDFLFRHRDRDMARGRSPAPHWKPKAHALGYNWRHDAWKFCRQEFIPAAAARACHTEFLAWFDGDVVFFDWPPASHVITQLLPPDRSVAYLGRHPKWSEIGFQLYRLPAAMPMLEEFSRLYSSDEVFALKESHSAFVFDTALARFPGMGWDLTPGGRGHVWLDSPLAHFSEHMKGSRKSGFSPETGRRV